MKGRTDVTATQNLVTAAARVKHLVFVSIVGIDRIPISYYKGKLAAEQLVAGLPHTILRATQFHDLVHKVLAAAAKLPVMPLPTIPFQPVDVRDVATQLVELVQGGPQGRVPDYRGTRSAPAGVPGGRVPARREPPPPTSSTEVARQSVPRLPGRRQPGPTGQPDGHDHLRRVPGRQERAMIRAGLIFLALAQGGAGLLQLFGPRTFYDDFPLPASPWVSLLPPLQRAPDA
jgi:hypothetical protein